MEISAAPIIYILIFVSVVLLVEGLYLVAFGRSIRLNAKVSRRLDLLAKHGNREQVLEQLRKEMSQHLKARGIPLYSILASKAQKANIAFSPQQLVLVMLVLSVFAFMGLTLATGAALPVRILLALGMGIGGVYFWVNGKAKRRMTMLEEQLPDAVELMVRALRVGHPFAHAVASVASELPDPIGTEFGVIADEAAYGKDISVSLREFAERMENQDLRFLAMAVTIQQQSGGNLAEILEGLAKVIRARFKLFRRVKAITAEAKWSGNFLSAFPVVALIAINVIKPDYFDDVRGTSAFMPAAIFVVVMLILNVVFMRMMVNIKV